MRWPKGEHNE